VTGPEYSKAVVALACWRAAQTELHQAMLCICMVFMNRALVGWCEGDLYENAARWLQENPGNFPDIRDPQFGQLLAKLDGVISGAVPDKTGGALWFWSKTDDPIQGSITTTIGNLIFVR
jgi:hypothetical protein